MVTRAHASLTGADLHEPKGVASAAVNTIYVASGTGTGTWQKLTTSNFSTVDNPFDANLVHMRDEKTAGTNPQSLTASTWNIRTINTSTTNQVTGASLASNQITLPTGIYFIEAWVPGFACGLHKAKLYNLTSAADQILGTAAWASSTSPYGFSYSTIKGRLVLTSQAVFEIRHYVTVTSASVALAVGTSTEVYTEVWFWKVG